MFRGAFTNICHNEQYKILLIKWGGFLKDAGDDVGVDVELSIFMKSMFGPAL